MPEIILNRDNGPDLVFGGTLAAEASSREFKTGTETWVVLKLWRTDSGQFVLARERWVAGPQRERLTAVHGTIHGDAAAVIEAEGWSPLSKRLFQRAGIAPQQERVE